MAVTQRGSATTDVAVAGTATVTKPAGVTTGDVLIAKCTSYDTAGQTVESPGWTLLAETVPGGTSSTSLHILTRTVTDGGTEPASYDFDETTPYYLTVELTAWSGVDDVTIGTFATGGSGSGGGAKTLPGITMPAAGQLLAACSAYSVGWTSLSSPWSVLVENLDSVNSLFAQGVAFGATGDVSVSTTGTTSYAAVLIGLVEPVGVTSVPTVWGLPASAV